MNPYSQFPLVKYLTIFSVWISKSRNFPNLELCLSHNAQMLKSTSEIVAKTKLLTDALDSTKKQMCEKMEVLQKSYTKREEKSNQVESI